VSARALALSICALYVAFVAATFALIAVWGSDADEGLAVLFTGFVAVGTLIAIRQPGNAVGWLLAGIGLAFAFNAVTEAYVGTDIGVARPAVGWISGACFWFWLSGAAVFLPLVFPHGRLLSPRWRAAVWLGVAAVVLSTIGESFKQGQLDLDTAGIENPLGLGGAAGEAVAVAGTLGNVLFAAGAILGAASVVIRFRRSRGTERQQLKWFAYVGVLAMAALLTALIAPREGGPAWADAIAGFAWFSALGLVVIGLPLATGIAILRHRLYDIDVVIRRTLVYGALTATLAAAYLALVLLSGLAVGDSDLAVAGATLAVAALFRPARSHIQAMVDRRFFRSRYDATRTLEDFGARLRDEIDLEALGADLRGVVRETVQPAHVSLWLRSGS
jgi:hypothetical protein